MRILEAQDAIIVVDAQNDFFPGGALGVEGGEAVVPVINRLLPLFKHQVFTRDWHPAGHVTFEDPPEFQDFSWPPHAVQGSPGADYHPELEVPAGALEVRKGIHPAWESYSGFSAEELDLALWLRNRGVRRVFVTGLATDFCVNDTVLDACDSGFRTFVVEDAVRGVAPETTGQAVEEMQDAGALFITSSEIL